MELYLKQKDLDAVAAIAPDVVEMFEVGDMGKVTIKPTDVKDCDYRYEIDSGSTVKKDEILENQTLTEILGFIKDIPGAIDMMMQGGRIPLGNMELDLGELMKRWIISSGTSDWDKILLEKNENENENDLNMEDPNVAGAVQGAFQPPAPIPNDFEDPTIAQAFDEIQGMASGGQPQGY